MITIIDYGVGNLGSIANMLKKVGTEAAISSDPAVIESADKLILPGVGAFDAGMRTLAASRLIPLLNQLVLEKKIPVLGLCLGLQLIASRSEEGNLAGLGWIDASVTRFRFDPPQPHLRVPHMGWNTIEIEKTHPLLTGLNGDSRFYFVHSYHLTVANPDAVLARTEYGYRFDSIVGKDNIMGVQFHPEKSHRFGMTLLRNFAECV